MAKLIYGSPDFMLNVREWPIGVSRSSYMPIVKQIQNE